MLDYRVPPAVSFAFEKIVSKVCDEAKVDYEERPLVARELLNHLESFWRQEIEKGLSTEDAQENALKSFGLVRDVARTLRKPLWRRLLHFERYRAERFIVFLGVSIAANFFSAILELELMKPNSFPHVLDFMALGYMLNPFFAIAALFTVRWKPKSTHMAIQVLAWIRFILSPLLLTGLLSALFGPVTAIETMLSAGLPKSSSDFFVLCCLILLVPLGIIAAACFISELFGLPKRQKCRGYQ